MRREFSFSESLEFFTVRYSHGWAWSQRFYLSRSDTLILHLPLRNANG